ncbi:MAG TPA: EAL domain-containing protein [Pseudolabrys sp.]|nr:EAL domain-containing protein [Pseudolabrys sp.]
METPESKPPWRYWSLLLVILGVLVAGTWFTVQATTSRLLYRNATHTAHNWADYLAANVGDLEQIAAGETPSSASMDFFRATKHSEEVYRYVIFNRYGYSILVADHGQVTPVDVSEYDPIAASALKADGPIVDARSGRGLGEPVYLAQAYVPAEVGGRAVAIVAAYVDLTDERVEYLQASATAALSLCGLTALAFGLPAIAWYRRTREKQQADRRIRFLAHHDTLTGLANRALVIDRLEGALALLPSVGGMIALHFIDIDQFKQVNDTLGHDGGDFLLKTVGERLRVIVRAEDMVARLGGDEFVVVQTGVISRADAEAFAARIKLALGAVSYFREQEIRTNFTIGVALAPADGSTAERLLKSADLALYAGKTAGRNCIRFFVPEMDEALRQRIELEKLMRDAVATGGFVLHYQPVFEMERKHLVGFEALLRLPATDGTLIPPDRFIPLAEEMRLIDQIGNWVLREACQVAATWPSNLTVAVNLSPAQFEGGAVEIAVADALRRSGLSPGRLELEITERLLLANSEAVIGTLRQLKEMGVSIVMDDFGTGYSSLSYLWKFPFDKIKIDRSFMASFDKSGREVETVVRTIIALGREMKMRVTVEGVETAGQVDFLYDAHADQVQGFYFGRPVPAKALSADVLANFLNATVPEEQVGVAPAHPG